MKLLILTQKVDASAEAPALGFFVRWIEEFAKRCEEVVVICLSEGTHPPLPRNVRIYSLGKEKGIPRIARKFIYPLRLYRLLWRLRGSYTGVFIHMNPEYAILGGPLWRLARKKIVLWYVHREVNMKLRLATLFANEVVTAAPESFRLKTRKLHVLGHGIDVRSFAASDLRAPPAGALVTVGRITPIKNLEVCMGALKELQKRGIEARLDLIGKPVTDKDIPYADSLRSFVEQEGLSARVRFRGVIAHDEMPREYPNYALSINATPTGGLDKVVFESMAAGTPALTSNEGFAAYFGPYAPRLLFRFGDAADLAARIEAFLNAPDRDEVRKFLRESALRRAGVEGLIGKILHLYERA